MKGSEEGSRSERRRAKTEWAKTLTRNFLKAFRNSDMMEAFIKAGNRMRQATEMWEKDEGPHEAGKASAGERPSGHCAGVREAGGQEDKSSKTAVSPKCSPDARTSGR